MALPVVKINGSTGSNITASGAGPGDGTISGTAVFGSGASYSTTTVTVPNADLTNVTTDGSSTLYLNTSTGRKFFRITATANSGTASASVTVHVAPTGTSTGLSYAIGGKRENFENANQNTKQLFADAEAGWRIELEDIGSPYILTSTITWSASGSLTSGCVEFVGTNGTPEITTATNSVNLITCSSTDYIWVENIKFSNTAGTRAAAFLQNTSESNDWFILDCIFDGVTTPISILFRIRRLYYDNCWFRNCSAVLSIAVALHVSGCYFEDCTNIAFSPVGTSLLVAYYNIFDSNGDSVLQTDATVTGSRLVFFNNTCYGSADTVINLRETAVSANFQLLMSNNIFYGTTGYAVATTAITDQVLLDIMLTLNCNNAYGSNTSGNLNNVPAGTDDVALTTDPFTDATNGDFSLNDTSGGGVELVDAGFPSIFFNGDDSYRPIGAVWSQPSATAPITVVPDFGAATGACIDVTVIPGSKTITISDTSVGTGTGVDISIVPGGVSYAPDTATSAATGEDITLIVDGVEVTVLDATATATAIDVSSSAGVVTATPEEVSIAGDITDISIVVGIVTVTVIDASADGTIQDLTITSGTVTSSPETATGSATVEDVADLIHNVSKSPDNAVAAGTGTDVVIAGTVSVTTTAGSAVGEIDDVTIVVTVSMFPDAADATGSVEDSTVTVGTTNVSIEQATAVGTGQNATIVAGEIGIVPDTASAAGTGLNASIIVTGISVIPGDSIASAVGEDVVVEHNVILAITDLTTGLAEVDNVAVIPGQTTLTTEDAEALASVTDISSGGSSIVEPDIATVAIATVTGATAVGGAKTSTVTEVSAASTTAQDATAVGGAISTLPTNAIANGTITDAAVLISEITVSMTEVSLANALATNVIQLVSSISVNVTDTSTAVGTGVNPSIAASGISSTPETASADALAVDVSSTAETSVAPDAGEAAGTVEDTITIGGPVSTSPDQTLATATGVDSTAVPAAISASVLDATALATATDVSGPTIASVTEAATAIGTITDTLSRPSRISPTLPAVTIAAAGVDPTVNAPVSKIPDIGTATATSTNAAIIVSAITTTPDVALATSTITDISANAGNPVIIPGNAIASAAITDIVVTGGAVAVTPDVAIAITVVSSSIRSPGDPEPTNDALYRANFFKLFET